MHADTQYAEFNLPNQAAHVDRRDLGTRAADLSSDLYADQEYQSRRKRMARIVELADSDDQEESLLI